MTTRSQLQEVQRKIADITAEMRKVQSALTAIQDTEHIDFLRNKHGRLHKERVAFCQQETILLQGQASALGDVFFDVIAQEAEFPDYSFGLITTNNEVRLVDVTNALASHTPPLRLISVNNVLPSARPGNATLAANFRDGDRLQLVAAIAPGHAYFDAYPRPFEGFTKGLPWSWILK